jgi:DNA-binding CsgD family transcriptional regulator/tetratricopeptide (TPR) repeat protein
MPGTLSSPVLVGRAAELAALDVALRRAEAGTPTIILIGGDAGLGKSRLVEEFAIGARGSGARVLVGGCVDLGGEGVPYGPFLEALRALGRELPAEELAALLGDVGLEIVAVAPGFERFLAMADGAPPPDPATGPGAPATGPAASPAGSSMDQARLFELSLALTDRLSSDRPLVLVLEDFHWSDPASRDLLAYLARNLRHGRVVVIATFRSDDLERGHPLLARLAEIGRFPGVERLELRPLNLAEQREQLAAILGRKPARGVVERIHARAEGNPFFAEEIVASRSGSDETDPGAIPRSLRDILIGRVARLSEDAQRVLGAVAVAGSRADEALLATVIDLPDGALVEAIREAVARHVLEVDDGAGTYRLRHALLTEVVYADLLPVERRRLHAAVAGWLAEEVAGEGAGARGRRGTAAELAHHWFAADNLPESLRASVEAAEAATAVHAHADALRHLQRAIELWARVADPAELTGIDRASLFDRAALAADRDGRGSLAVEFARAMLASIDESTEPILAGVMRSKLAFYLWTTGQTQASVAEYRAAVELVPAEPPSVERARVLGGLAATLPAAGRYRESREITEEALGTLRAAGSHEGEPRLLNLLGMDLVGLGDIDAGLDHLRVAVRIARETGALESQIGAQHNLAFFLSQTDRFEEGLRVAMDALATATRVGLERRYGAGLRASAGDILMRSGRWDEADQMTAEGRDGGEDTSGAIYLRATRVLFLTARGESEAAAAELAGAEELATGDIDPDVQAYLLQATAELALHDNRPADALRAVEQALAEFAGSDEMLLVAPLLVVGMTAAADLADHGRAFRDPAAVAAAQAAAEALIDQARTLAAGNPAGATLTPSVGAAVATVEAERTRLDGRSEADAWRQAAAAWDAVHMPYPAAQARARAGEAVLLARGPRDDAASLLRDAHAAASDLGAVPLQNAIEAIATRSRILLEVPATVPAHPAEEPPVVAPDATNPAKILGLSAREWEVLELVAAGRSNAEIAETLYISPKTASVHVTHILDKLGVNNRVEAATIAVRVGAGQLPDAARPPDQSAV